MKSSGGNRLKIEDTSGSEDEEENGNKNVKNKKANIETAAKFSDSLRKKNIKITEVESDDYEDEEDNKTEDINNKIDGKENKIKNEEEISLEKIVEKKDYQLPKNVINLKDKANNNFTNGHYGDALNYFTQAINALQELESKSSNFLLFYLKNYIYTSN